jgi:hypothetical protein
MAMALKAPYDVDMGENAGKTAAYVIERERWPPSCQSPPAARRARALLGEHRVCGVRMS